jgi:hypothetical protein
VTLECAGMILIASIPRQDSHCRATRIGGGVAGKASNLGGGVAGSR